jgi:hypothetical protein
MYYSNLYIGKYTWKPLTLTSDDLAIEDDDFCRNMNMERLQLHFASCRGVHAWILIDYCSS